MLLSKKVRQEYLKYLGYYTGAIDGVEGINTKKAYLQLQKDYCFRSKDIDGKYGTITDIILRNAYKVKRLTKNFDLKNELACKCKGKYCSGYPAVLDDYLLIYLQDFRDEYGVIKTTSCLRCSKHNKLVGGITGSKHVKGKAIDIQNSKICKSMSTKKAFIDKAIKKDKMAYVYTNGYARTKKKTTYPKWSSMSSTVHFNV